MDISRVSGLLASFRGITFFMMIDGCRIECLVSRKALAKKAGAPLVDDRQLRELFARYHSEIQQAVERKVDKCDFESDGTVCLHVWDLKSGNGIERRRYEGNPRPWAVATNFKGALPRR
jgi:Protein of unknown function (DUF1488)